MIFTYSLLFVHAILIIDFLDFNPMGIWRNLFGRGDSSDNQEPTTESVAAHAQALESNVGQVCVHIRWMIRRDMPQVLEIENQSFEFPWSEKDYIRCLRQRDCIGMVAEFRSRIVGSMVYELHQSYLHLLNFATHENCRRRGVGTAMVNKMKNKLSHHRRSSILLEVRETNLPAQLFFRENRFRAFSVLRDFYEDTIEDAYLMRYVHPPALTKEETLFPREGDYYGRRHAA